MTKLLIDVHPDELIPEKLSVVSRWLTWLNLQLRGKNWMGKAIGICLGTLLFFSLPSYERFWQLNHDYKSIWDVLGKQIEHPLTPTAYDPISHEAKIAFRLVPPLLGYLVPLDTPASRLLFVFFVQHLCGVLFFWLLLKWVYRVTRDRVISFLLVFSMVFIYLSRCFFYEFYPFFDGIAFLFMFLALYVRNPWLAFTALSVAYWTDERAIIASPVIVWYHLLDTHRWEKVSVQSILKSYSVYGPYVVSLLLYVGIRLVLTNELGLHIPIGSKADAGLAVAYNQLTHLPLAITLTYEGWWFILLAAAVYLLESRKYVELIGGLLAFGAVVGVSSCVWDVTRSVCYSFPALLICFRYVVQYYSRREVSRLLVIIVCLNLLIPTYKYHFHNFFWQVPAPIKLVNYAIQAGANP